MPDQEQKVVLFVDNQNMYKGARHTFFSPPYGHHIDGQFDPVLMGDLLCSRPPAGFVRTLSGVRVYTGQPSSSKDPKGYGASRKQQARWKKRGAEVFPRPLRYPWGYPTQKPEEKGIDVLLAIDFVALAIAGEYDVGIIASTDTDLLPAIEYVLGQCSPTLRAEVAAWSGPGSNPRLSSKKHNFWCHWLKQPDYEAIRDHTDYTL